MSWTCSGGTGSGVSLDANHNMGPVLATWRRRITDSFDSEPPDVKTTRPSAFGRSAAIRAANRTAGSVAKPRSVGA